MNNYLIEPREEMENEEYLTKLLEEHQDSNDKAVFLKHHSYSYLLSENGINIGGYIATQQDDIVHLQLLAVDDKSRGKGYGEALLKHLINLAKKQDATRITLTTLDFQAKDFYMKHGFHIFGELYDTPVKGVKKYYLTLVL